MDEHKKKRKRSESINFFLNINLEGTAHGFSTTSTSLFSPSHSFSSTPLPSFSITSYITSLNFSFLLAFHLLVPPVNERRTRQAGLIYESHESHESAHMKKDQKEGKRIDLLLLEHRLRMHSTRILHNPTKPIPAPQPPTRSLLPPRKELPPPLPLYIRGLPRDPPPLPKFEPAASSVRVIRPCPMHGLWLILAI